MYVVNIDSFILDIVIARDVEIEQIARYTDISSEHVLVTHVLYQNTKWSLFRQLVNNT